MREDSVGWAKQNGAGPGGLGTKNAVVEYFTPVESASRGQNTETMEREETVGHPFPTDVEPGTTFWRPSIVGACRSASLPRVLSPFLGDPLTTTPDGVGAPTARNHNFDPVARPTPRAVSLLLNNTDPSPAITDLIWDAIGDELTLSVEPEDWIAYEASLLAREIDQTQGEPSASADLTRRFAFYECKAYLSVDGGAESELDVGDFSFTYGLNAKDDDKILGSRRLYKVGPRNRAASVTFTAKEDIRDHHRRVMLDTPQRMKIRLEALGPTIGAAVKHKVEVIVHRCFAIEAPVDVSAADSLDGVEVTAQAAYNAADGKFVETNVVNTVTAY